MKKVLMILIVLSVFIIAACGEKKVTFKDPDLTDKDQATNDDDSSDDTPVTDHDSPVTDNDSPVTDNDSPLTDDDSPLPDDNETPDEIGVDCEPEGVKKCDGSKSSILECSEGAWITNQICESDETCDDTREAILCAPHICVPATTYCKMGNVYTCANDGLSEEMTTDCTATQYCDDTSDPATCKDQVCTPDELYCDGNVLKECNGIGSGGTVEKDCDPDGECDEGLENCVYTGEVGGTFSFDRTGQRGNFFDCTKNVEVIEFAHELEYTGGKDLSWAIYEAEGNSTTYSRIFIKSAATTGTGKAYYSTGTISVNLVSGRKYIFITAWTGTIKVYYDNNPSTADPIMVGFGSTEAGHSISNNSLPDSYINPARYEIVYNQQIKFVE